MRLNRGCGCLALVLALINVFVVISVMVGVVGGSTSLAMGMTMAAVFVGNVAACVMVGLPSLRRGSASEPAADEEAKEVVAAEGEEGEEDD